MQPNFANKSTAFISGTYTSVRRTRLEPSGKHLRMSAILLFMKEWHNCESSFAGMSSARNRQLPATGEENLDTLDDLNHTEPIRYSPPTPKESGDRSRSCKCG
ncbi:hypothetical protein T265_12157 [Opisthorchis viverrini]|uniref:Uncharacterized protein n=1 Tax=Opisthorchis viverrini TaxID=6198 RepID=A0A074YVI3_OPIVI|nr:hypothetical protein T265_12157 [Opisthorchis viverrini]KER18781.1 hypothetical protein T265_12157 [Opisthorchis viverrini]